MTMMTSVIAFEPRASQPLLRRPRLLVQAARAGLAGWNRDRDLKREVLFRLDHRVVDLVVTLDLDDHVFLAPVRLLSQEQEVRV